MANEFCDLCGEQGMTPLLYFQKEDFDPTQIVSLSLWGLTAELWVTTPSLGMYWSVFLIAESKWWCWSAHRPLDLHLGCSGSFSSFEFLPLYPPHHLCPHYTAGTQWLFLLRLWTRQDTSAAPRTGAHELLEEGKVPSSPFVEYHSCHFRENYKHDHKIRTWWWNIHRRSTSLPRSASSSHRVWLQFFFSKFKRRQ